MTRRELEAVVRLAHDQLEAAESALRSFNALPENNSYASLHDALSTIESVLLSRAQADCEGSYNCGDEEYTQEFVVDGKHYIGKLECEYNRHDKMYYYIDEHDFTYAVVE